MAPASEAAAAAPKFGSPDPMAPRPFHIREVRRETADTFTWLMDPADGGGFAFAPGQFNMLWQFGVGEVAISISGGAADGAPLMHTIRAVGSVTNVMAGLKPGVTVGMRGPFGSPWPMAELRGRDVVLICGGTGLAPLRPALLHLLAHRADYGKVVLLYGVRAPEHLLFKDELERWAARSDLECRVAVGLARPGWTGHVGVVTGFIDRVAFDPSRATALICGPEIMMHYAVEGMRKRGTPETGLLVSLERNMKCAVGFCGHCQFGPVFICRDGPVFRYDRVRPFLGIREL